MSKRTNDTPAARIVAKFGGVRAMARTLGKPHTTVHSWAVTGRIPAHRQEEILKIAREKGIKLRPDDFFAGAA